MKRNNSEKILLLSNLMPCKNFSGGILNLQLVKMLQEEKIDVHCFVVREYDLFELVDEEVIQKLKLKTFNLGNNYRINNIKLYNIAFSLLKYIKKNNITKIWCPVQGDILINLLTKILKYRNINYYVQIWDPIEWTLLEQNRPDKYIKKTQKRYDALVERASYCFTASFQMAEIYKLKYGIKTQPLFTSFKKETRNYIKKEENLSESIIIALSGQLYAEKEISLLLKSLDLMNWEFEGKPILFEHYGSEPSILKSKRYKRKNIILKGHFDQPALIESLKKADLLYCPYMFSQNPLDKKIVVESFPSKVVTYLTTSVPILIHAPNYSSVYKMFENQNAAFLIDTTEEKFFILKLRDILKQLKNNEISFILENSEKFLLANFEYLKIKSVFFEGLNFNFDKSEKHKILQVNYGDLPGKQFNGFEISKFINACTKHSSNQIVTYKTSKENFVYKLWNDFIQNYEYQLLAFENQIFGVHSNLSLSSPALLSSDLFQNADIIHFHMFHNTKLSLYSLIEFSAKKRVILSIHDPWTITGRCVHFEDCNLWKSGCGSCPTLKNLFELPIDNSKTLYKLKENVYSKIDVDIIVYSQYMYDLIKTSPLTKHFKKIHYIPFGVDRNKFNDSVSQKTARKKLNIPVEDAVLFFRSQKDFKGTNYIIEALDLLEYNKNITLITCSEVGLLNNLTAKYNIVELGNADEKDIITAFQSCDIFLMPSIGESFGMMAVEAMACGRPVIVFDNTALPSVTHAPYCGYLVKNKDSEDLKKAIDYLLSNPKERELRSQRGIDIVAKYYDLKRYNNKILETYENIMMDCSNEKLFLEKTKIAEEEKTKENIEVEKSMISLKRSLNILTKNLFEDSPTIKKELMYKVKKGSAPKFCYNIPFSTEKVQKILDEYNKKTYDLLIRKNIEIERVNSIHNNKNLLLSIHEKNKHVIYLFKNDRPLLIEKIKFKLSNHKNLLALFETCRKIYRFFAGSFRKTRKKIKKRYRRD